MKRYQYCEKQHAEFFIVIIFISILLTTTLVSGTIHAAQEKAARITVNLDTGWLFIAADNSAYASATANESEFKRVCVPHANTITKHAYQSEAAFRFVSWYRRHFIIPESWSDKRFLLEFQAVSINAVVYVNGTKAGEHKGGYTPFTIDITGNINVGRENVIAVQVDSKPHSDIPPEGGAMDYMIYGGIVRHVNLIVVDPLHLEWVFAATKNPNREKPISPVVTVKTKVINSSNEPKNCTIIHNVIDIKNTIVATATGKEEIPANESHDFNLTTSAISSPQLWSVDNPNLYHLHSQIKVTDKIVDDYITRIGIRSITMDKTDGKCYLNGSPLKLRGLNRHETYPFIGRAAAKRLQRKDADILKYDLGCNIVRTSHYPQSPDFLDRCDEIGLLVLEEIPGWQYIGNDSWKGLQIQNLKDMIIRDRNHPCILTWGVRVNESADNNSFYKITNDTAHVYDPTRLTCGVRRGNSDPATSFLEDIWTQNFVTPSQNPDNMPQITTEWCGHNLNPQAHSWDNDDIQLGQITNAQYGHGKGHNESYKNAIWGGLLGWCAFDYASSHAMATTSETGRGKNSYVCPHGVASIFRLPKLAGWFYQSQRDPTLYGPMVHICNFWTSKSPTNVMVVSNCEQVELFQDGKSLGKKSSGNLYTSLPHPVFSWATTFTPGELKAVGYIGGTQSATHIVRTPGNPAAITVVPDTTTIFEGGDMTRVVVSLVDSFGQILHLHDDTVSLSATGAGDFIGEEKTALEGGQMAFFVKTHSSGSGIITCQAKIAGLTGAATITVKEDLVASRRIPAPVLPSIHSKKKLRCVILTDRSSLPLMNGHEGASFRIYDLKGRQIYTGTLKKNGIYGLTGKITAQGIRIVELEEKQVTTK